MLKKKFVMDFKLVKLPSKENPSVLYNSYAEADFVEVDNFTVRFEGANLVSPIKYYNIDFFVYNLIGNFARYNSNVAEVFFTTVNGTTERVFKLYKNGDKVMLYATVLDQEKLLLYVDSSNYSNIVLADKRYFGFKLFLQDFFESAPQDLEQLEMMVHKLKSTISNKIDFNDSTISPRIGAIQELSEASEVLKSTFVHKYREGLANIIFFRSYGDMVGAYCRETKRIFINTFKMNITNESLSNVYFHEFSHHVHYNLLDNEEYKEKMLNFLDEEEFDALNKIKSSETLDDKKKAYLTKHLEVYARFFEQYLLEKTNIVCDYTENLWHYSRKDMDKFTNFFKNEIPVLK